MRGRSINPPATAPLPCAPCNPPRTRVPTAAIASGALLPKSTTPQALMQQQQEAQRGGGRTKGSTGQRSVAKGALQGQLRPGEKKQLRREKIEVGREQLQACKHPPPHTHTPLGTCAPRHVQTRNPTQQAGGPITALKCRLRPAVASIDLWACQCGCPHSTAQHSDDVLLQPVDR